MRKHLQTSVENFVTRQSQVRVAAAKKHREQFGEILVDDIERGLQEITCFAVDAFDGRLECGDGFIQIERLRVEECFTFARLLKLCKRRQIHCAQFGNRCIQSIDFSLICSRAGFFFHRLGEFFKIGTSVGKLLCIIFFVDARFLLLHAQLGNLVAQWLQTVLDGTFFLFQLFQYAGRRFHRIAGVSERFLGVNFCTQGQL